MTAFPATVVALAVLGAAGALPSLLLAGPRWVAVPLAPLAGAVVAAAAAACCLAFGGPDLAWFVALAALAAAVCATVLGGALVTGLLTGVPGRRVPQAYGPPMPRVLGAAAAVVVVGAAAWCLLALRAPTVGFDARTTWLLHGVWFAGGHGTALDALRNPALSFAHATYPPLVGGSVAVSWLVTGERSYAVGVSVIALLNACVAVAVAWVAVEAGWRTAAGVPERSRAARALPQVAGVVVAGLLVLVLFGVAGPFATNGYADMLWAAAAVGAVGYGLILPGTGRDLGAAVLLLAVAGLTKDEGIATGMAVVVLMALRRARGARSASPGRVPWGPLAAGLAGVLALGAWPVLVRVLGAYPDVPVSGRRQGGELTRAHLTASAMAPHLHVVVLAGAVALGGAVWLRRVRRSAGIGNDAWAWASLAAGAGAVVAAYVTGPGNVEFWLATSVHRTTFFPAMAAWLIVGIWALVAAGGVPDPPGTPDEQAALDDDRPVVLHHGA